MKKKQLLFITMMLFFTAPTWTQVKTIPSKLTGATVFYQGAELTHTASTNLIQGSNEITIEGLTDVIDINSIKIKTTNGVLVSAYEFSKDYLTSSKTPDANLKNFEDSIKIYENRLDQIEIDLKVDAGLSDQLQKGITKSVSGSENGLGIDELMKTMEYYKSETEKIEKRRVALTNEKKKINENVKRLKAVVEQESLKGNKISGILKLTLSSPLNTNCTFTVSYFTYSASWSPFHSINVASTDVPIKITQKAKVRQTTGMDWEKVNLTLSTGIPSNGKVAPLFTVWMLREKEARMFSNADMMQNSFSYAPQSEVFAENKLQVRGSSSIYADSSPLYVINGEIVSKEEVDILDTSHVKSMEVLKDASATALYGSRATNGVILITLKDEMDDYVTESDNALNLIYNISIPYNIPGNGKEQNIELFTKETGAEYKYYCAPKLDSETFLLAEIFDPQNLGLLSGKANVTYDGTYVGETYIDANSTQSKLTLTLGTDKRVSVKRERMKDYSSKKTLGSDILQTFAYKITVKNNRTNTIKMVLKDQYPTSSQKGIKVELLDTTTSWTANVEELGVITWEEEFKPGETKTYIISYSVKYPKNMNLNL